MDSDFVLSEYWSEIDNITGAGTDFSEKGSCEDLVELEPEDPQSDWLKEAGFDEYTCDDYSLDTNAGAFLRSLSLTNNQYNTIRKRFNSRIKQASSDEDFGDSVPYVDPDNEPINEPKSSVEVVPQLSVCPSKQRADVRMLFPRKGDEERDGLTCSKKKSVTFSGPEEWQEESRTRASSTSGISNYGTYNATTNKAVPEDRSMVSTYYTAFPGYASEGQPARRARERQFLKENEKSPKLINWSGHSKEYRINNRPNRRPGSWFFDTGNSDNSDGIEILSMKSLSTVRGNLRWSLLEVPPPPSQMSSCENSCEALTLDIDMPLDILSPEGLGIQISNSVAATGLPVISLPNGLSHVTIESLVGDEIVCKKLRSLALIELSSVFDSFGYEYEKMSFQRKKRKTKKPSGRCLFGSSIGELLERDRRKYKWKGSVPFILHMLIEYIKTNGLEEEGILRMAGAHHRVQSLREELEKLYYSMDEMNKEMFLVQLLNEYSIPDITGVFKQLIRELVEPLLSNNLEAFLVVPKIKDTLHQVQILNLLLLILDVPNRNSLQAVLDLLQEIGNNCGTNRMTVQNVSTVMAPTLFPSLLGPGPAPVGGGKKGKKCDANKLNSDSCFEMERALNSCIATKMLIHFNTSLFHVPPYLLHQIGYN